MRFKATLITEIEFVDGDHTPDGMVQNYQTHLSETLQEAAQNLSLRTTKGANVESVTVEEIKDSPPDAKPPASV